MPVMYWTLPNNTTEHSLLTGALENGWEIYGYSNYGFDGVPSKVELKKETK